MARSSRKPGSRLVAEASLATHRLVLEYDGTDFDGWQRQGPGARTVQGVLETALAQIVGGAPALIGASRTDAGVHAEGQVASARFETRLEPATLRRALNASLPQDVAVVALARAPDAFHALRDARAKLYRYGVWNGDAPSPLRARRFHHQRGRLDLAAMREAAAGLVGRHDFASFQTGAAAWRAEGRERGEERSTVRTLLCIDVLGEAGGELRFEVRGDGFLRQMVRTLVGTLLEVGRGHRLPGSMATLLEARSRPAAGPAAPARGLTLVHVDYSLGALGDAAPGPSGPPERPAPTPA